MFGKKGFTLLELIIVIIVIGILASIALPRYLQVAEKARAAEGKSVLGILRSAQMRYISQYGNYSTGSINTTLDVSITTPVYFAWPTLPTPAATLDNQTVAQIVRGTKDCPSQYTGYTLTIAADGTIGCTETAPATCPQGIIQ